MYASLQGVSKEVLGKGDKYCSFLAEQIAYQGIEG